MNRFLRVSLVLVLSLGTVSLMSGCTTHEARATGAAEEQFEDNEFSGEVESSESQHVTASTDGEPTNHERMAMVILQRSGHDSDLSTYDRVDLVTMTMADGSEVMAVVLDGDADVVFPKNMESGQ